MELTNATLVCVQCMWRLPATHVVCMWSVSAAMGVAVAHCGQCPCMAVIIFNDIQRAQALQTMQEVKQ